MAFDIHLVRVRKGLPPRREPYWGARISRGKYLGFRKVDDDRGTWIARVREDDTGRQQYKALGWVSDGFDYDAAKAAALAWFKDAEAGVTPEVVTVADACREYVIDRERDKGKATAHDARKRFERTVYEAPLGAMPLGKVRASHIKAWRDSLGLSKASANRTLTALKAALNMAVRDRRVGAAAAQEWADVKPYAAASQRRDLFLDLEQRRALLAETKGALRHLIEAAMVTGARAGELVNAKASQFDSRTKTMTFIGKTGTRTVPLSAPAVRLFKRLARKKGPDDFLLIRADGKQWAHSDWDELVREAAEAAELPAGVCLYTLRHSFITQAISDGMTTLDVARLVGTSLAMIDKHYGQFAPSAARERLAKVSLI